MTMPWCKVDPVLYVLSWVNEFALFQRSLSFFRNPPNVQAKQNSDTMDTATGEPIQSSINPQLASPLFAKIPAEIRNHIFRLVLTFFDDQTRPYKKSAFYYRPDHRYAQIIDTTLLLTCRRVFAETRNLPASINEHTSWYNRPPPDVDRNSLPMEDSPAALKRRSQVAIIHIFTQQFWLEDQFQRWTKRQAINSTTCLKITLRHTDWW